MASRHTRLPLRRVTLALPVLASLVVYLVTLAPTVTAEDSGELIAAADCFGVPHPPGYPLWTMLCGVFIRAVPLGAIAWRANLFSAVCAALSTLPLSLALMSAGVRRVVALSVAVVWALGATLWSQAVVTEVYGLHALLCALLLWAFVTWWRTGARRRLVWASLFLGLGLSNHHTIGFLALALGAWAVARVPGLVRDWRLAGLCAAALLAGLLPYAYLPLRAAAGPPLNWGDPSTPSSFVAHVTRAQYGPTAPLAVDEGRSLPRYAAQLAYAAGVAGRDLTPPLAIAAAAGLALMLARREPLGLLALLVLLSCGALFLLVANIDLDRTFRFAMRVFLVPLSLGLSLPLAFALDRLVDLAATRGSPRAGRLAAGAVPAVALLPLVLNFRAGDYRDYWYARDHGEAILASMLPGGLLFPSGDHTAFPVIYLTMVEGLRPDVTVADKYGYTDPAVLAAIAAETGDPIPAAEPERVRWLVLGARRPAYFCVKTAPPVEAASLVPVGVVYHLLPGGRSVDLEVWGGITYRREDVPPRRLDLGACVILGDLWFFRGLDALRRGSREDALACFARSTGYTWGIKESFNNVGSALGEHGLEDEAIEYFERARAMDPGYMTPRRNLLRIYTRRGRWDEVEALERELRR